MPRKPKPKRLVVPWGAIPLRGMSITPEGVDGGPMGKHLPCGIWTIEHREPKGIVVVSCPDWPCRYRIRENTT